MSPKEKAEIKEKVMAAGRWNDFVKFREKLKAEGMSPKEAWFECKRAFLPDEGQTLQEVFAAEAEAAGDDGGVIMKLDEFDATPPGGESASTEEAVIPSGKPHSEDRAVAVPRQVAAKTVTAPSMPPLPKIVATFPTVEIEKFKNSAKGRADILEWVEFVANYVDVKDVTPEMAPAPGAWAWLQRVRSNREIGIEFYRVVLPKLLPSKTQMESELKFTDDGKSHRELIDKIIAACGPEGEVSVLSNGAEVAPPESPVSETTG